MAETKTKTRQKSAGKGDVFKQHGVSPELALDLLKEMLLYRRFEEKAEYDRRYGTDGNRLHNRDVFFVDLYPCV